MTTIDQTQCMNCVHWRETFIGTGVCEAFPDGIPFDVFTGQRLHDEPLEGDHGIQFEARGLEPHETAEPAERELAET